MLKKLALPLIATTIFLLSIISKPVNATSLSEHIVIDSVLDLCEISLNHGYWINDEGNCNDYSVGQRDATLNRAIYIEDNVVLKDLNLTFKKPNAVFYIMENGKLTIDGGHYTSPSCIIYIQYNNLEPTTYYVPKTTFAIDSGIFEATAEILESEESPSPVCVISPIRLTEQEARTVISDYLPTGRHFVNMEQTRRTLSGETEYETISIEDGFVHIQKNLREKDEIKYLSTKIVEVVKEDAEENEKEPEQEGSINDERQEQSSLTEEEIENPNTYDAGLRFYVVIFTVSFVVIFATKYRGKKQVNR